MVISSILSTRFDADSSSTDTGCCLRHVSKDGSVKKVFKTPSSLMMGWLLEIVRCKYCDIKFQARIRKANEHHKVEGPGQSSAMKDDDEKGCLTMMYEMPYRLCSKNCSSAVRRSIVIPSTSAQNLTSKSFWG